MAIKGTFHRRKRGSSAPIFMPYAYAYVRRSLRVFLLQFLLSSQNVLWDGFLTPEGSEGVPNDLRILHDMIALLQENKIR